MQEGVRQMVTPWDEPEELHVRHVRDPRCRVPVAGGARGQRPSHPGAAQTRFNVFISRDVRRVVVVYEIELADLPVKQQGQDEETRADPPRLKALFGVRHGGKVYSPSRNRIKKGTCAAGPSLRTSRTEIARPPRNGSETDSQDRANAGSPKSRGHRHPRSVPVPTRGLPRALPRNPPVP